MLGLKIRWTNQIALITGLKIKVNISKKKLNILIDLRFVTCDISKRPASFEDVFLLAIFNLTYLVTSTILILLAKAFVKSLPPGRKMVSFLL